SRRCRSTGWQNSGNSRPQKRRAGARPALQPPDRSPPSVRERAARHEAVVQRATDDVVVEAAQRDSRRADNRRPAVEREMQILEARAPVRGDGVIDAHAERPADAGVVDAEARAGEGAATVSETAGDVGQPAIP